MITLNVEYKDSCYPVLYHKGELFQLEEPDNVKYRLLSYFIELWKTTGFLSTGECVVCYEENKIGTLLGCCNFKHFLCVGCYTEMYNAFKFGCPCCRENMFPAMNARMANQKTWFQHESKKNDPWAQFFNKQYNFYNNKCLKIIRDLTDLGLDKYSEEELENTFEYDEETHSVYVCILKTTTVYFWDKNPDYHFNKIQRKVGYKPMNLVRLGGKMRTVME